MWWRRFTRRAARPSQVLAEALPGLVASLRFDKTMRWNASGVAFSRPIRWLLALLGEHVVPFRMPGWLPAGTPAACAFRNRKQHRSGTPDEYLKLRCESQGILLDPAARRQVIAEQVAQLQREVGAAEDVDPALLDEVTQLVEAPTALRGSFDPGHLRLPPEVLISVMKKHQRYFPVHTVDGQLMPYFIAVRNGGEQHLDVVTDGNEQVIRARFADAAFFIGEDLQAQAGRLSCRAWRR